MYFRKSQLLCFVFMFLNPLHSDYAYKHNRSLANLMMWQVSCSSNCDLMLNVHLHWKTNAIWGEQASSISQDKKKPTLLVLWLSLLLQTIIVCRLPIERHYMSAKSCRIFWICFWFQKKFEISKFQKHLEIKTQFCFITSTEIKCIYIFS